MNTRAIKDAASMKGTIPMTLPADKLPNCCVMRNSAGDWFAFFPNALAPDERREIEESVFEEMMEVSDAEEDL